MRKWVAILLIYVGLVTANTGFLNSHFEYYFYEPVCKDYRGDLAFSVAISLVPLTWIITPFMTGFYEHGWRLQRRPECPQ